MYPEEAYKELVEAGVFYGRSKSKTNPKMKPCVLTNRGGIEIINLAKTLEALEEAMGFLKEVVRQGGLVIVVGTQPSAQAAVLRLADKFVLPRVVTRWLGGTITNFKIIAKRIDYFVKQRQGLKDGSFEKYTKKERVGMEKELRRLEELMGGLENLVKEPNLLIVIDPVLHNTAVQEARRLNIPIIAFADVDSNPDFITYPVPGNNKSRKSIEWFLARVETAIEEGRAMQKVVPAVESPKNES